MVNIVTTRQNGPAIRSEWRSNPRKIMVNFRNRLLSPQYFQDSALEGLPIFLNNATAYNMEARKKVWSEQGGILLDRSPRSGSSGNRDCLVLIECPISELVLQQHQDGSEDLVIVNRPVTWVSHWEAINILFPPVAQSTMVFEKLKVIPGREFIAKMTKYPDSEFVLTMAEISEMTGILDKPMAGIASYGVVEIHMRYKPMGFMEIPFWNELMALEGTGKYRYMASTKANKALNTMIHRGCVFATHYRVFGKPFKPLTLKLAAEKAHYGAQIGLKNMIKFVEALPPHVPQSM